MVERRSEQCLNCHAATPGAWCSECGQRNSDHRVPLRTLIGEFLSETFEVDSRIGRTIPALLFKPGLLSVEYNRGRRAHYSSPLRLLLFAILVLFFTLSVVPYGLYASSADDDDDDDDEQSHVEVQVTTSNGDDDVLGGLTESLEDAIEASKAKATNDAPQAKVRVLHFLLEKTRRFDAMPDEQAARTIRKEALELAPKSLAIILPAFAFMLMVLYRRSRRYYAEHIIFSMHYLTWLCLVLTLEAIIPWDPWELMTLIAIQVYLFVALSRHYGESRVRTLVKLLILQASSFVLMLLALFVVLTLSVLVA